MQVSCSMRSIRAAIRRAHRQHPPGMRGDPHPCLFPPKVMRKRVVRYVRIVVPPEALEASYARQAERQRRQREERLEAPERHAERPCRWQRDRPRTFVRVGYSGLDARYFVDPVAIEFVRTHPDGASHAEVADALGVGKVTVYDTEQRAFVKLLERARGDDDDVRKWLFAMGQHFGLREPEEEFSDDAE